MDDETRARQVALDQAVRLRDTLSNPEDLVKAAEKFFEFLIGKKD